MSLNRRQFLKNTSIGTAGLIGGASMLRKSAFAYYPAPATSQLSFLGATLTGGTFPSQTFTYTSKYTSASATSSGTATNGIQTGRMGLVYDVLMPFQSAIAAAITGKTIIIKPNMVYTGSSSTYSATGSSTPLNCTHVDAVRGLINFLRDTSANVPIVIAEASATTTASMYNTCGFCALVTQYTGVTLVDLNTNSTVSSTGTTTANAGYTPAESYLWKTDLATSLPVYVGPIWLSKKYYIISICRPKTHNCEVITGVTKNCSMGMPLTYTGTLQSTNSKSLMHAVGDSQGTVTNEDRDLAWNIFQNATQYTLNDHPDFAVLDAWEGEQGNGPVSGTPVQQGCAVCGVDHVAVDRIGAYLMGLSNTPNYAPKLPDTTPSYTDPRYLLWMGNAGIGNYDINKISFINSGTTLATVTPYIQTYAMSTNYTTSPYYEVEWQTADTLGPGPVVGDTASTPNSPFTFIRGMAVPVTGVLGNPAPIMIQQKNMHVGGVVEGNEVKIDLFMPAGYDIKLGIFNMKGQQVRKLANEFLNNGRYSIYWDCRDDRGSKCANGNYVIKLQFGSRQVADHIALAR
jgi:uncharacterized protein (DUF362 family)